MTEAAPTAALLVIGNEILTGKVSDENTPFLAGALFDLGYVLRRVIVCPDERDTIATDLNALRTDHDVVFTSGGVGPTHDDVTIEAVAHAFGVAVVRSPAVEKLIRHWRGDDLKEAHLRMADLPEGAELIRTPNLPWPTICIGNVYVLPGVPRLFALKFEEIAPRLDLGKEFVSYAVYTACDEGTVAALLGKLHNDHDQVMIGSYPQWHAPDHKLKLTFDGTDRAVVDKAAHAFIEALEPSLLVRHGWASEIS